jgi:hypothetical protein
LTAARLDGRSTAPDDAPQTEPPWLRAPVLERLEALERGHCRAFGRPLLACDPDRPLRLWAQELFAAAEVVLAHDGADPGLDPGPRLIYANRAALRLWRRPWADLVGMPSRLTAEPEQRMLRSQALTQALRSGGLRGYAGIRIDSQGRRFQLSGARIWNLIGADGDRLGARGGIGRGRFGTGGHRPLQRHLGHALAVLAQTLQEQAIGLREAGILRQGQRAGPIQA